MAVTAAKVNDITAAKAMPIEAGATYVFDLGYYDYGWWARLDGAGCRIVTRLKSNTPLEIAEEIPVPGDGAILSDRIDYLPARQANSRTTLQRVYGSATVSLAKGWTSSPALKLTHVGRGFEGYTGEENSLQPSEEGRPSQTEFLAPRRLAPQTLTSLRAFLRRATYINRR